MKIQKNSLNKEFKKLTVFSPDSNKKKHGTKNNKGYGNGGQNNESVSDRIINKFSI